MPPSTLSESTATAQVGDNGASTGTGLRPRNRRVGQMNRWSRTFHVYVSMGCMLIVAFFALTGLTLNHPSWTRVADRHRAR